MFKKTGLTQEVGFGKMFTELFRTFRWPLLLVGILGMISGFIGSDYFLQIMTVDDPTAWNLSARDLRMYVIFGSLVIFVLGGMGCLFQMSAKRSNMRD